MSKMSDAEYLQTQTSVLLIGSLVENMALGTFVEMAEFSESFAPFADPTLYRAGASRLREIIKIARALLEFQKVANEVKVALEAMPPADLGPLRR